MRPPPCSPRLVQLALSGLLLGVWAFSGCTSVSPSGSSTALMLAGGAEVSLHELRTTQNVLALRVPGTFEAAADAISAQTTDGVLRRRTLLFKMEVVPAFYEALFNADPLAATLDAWALSIQLEAYLTTGAGKDFFGPKQSLAVEAASKVREQIEVAARAVAKAPDGFERAKGTVEKWALAHPIEGSFSSRPSILPELAKLSAQSPDISVFQAVGDIGATVNELSSRLNVYAAYLPRAGRWQAELLVEQLSDRTEALRVMSTFQSVERMTDRVSQLISPEALQAALDLSTAEVRKERLAALASVDTQRKETLVYLTQEREAAMAGVDAQRRDVMADVDRQRTALMQQVEALKKQTLQEVDDVAGRIIRKAALAMAGLIVLAAALTWLLTRSVMRPKA